MNCWRGNCFCAVRKKKFYMFWGREHNSPRKSFFSFCVRVATLLLWGRGRDHAKYMPWHLAVYNNTTLSPHVQSPWFAITTQSWLAVIMKVVLSLLEMSTSHFHINWFLNWRTNSSKIVINVQLTSREFLLSATPTHTEISQLVWALASARALLQGKNKVHDSTVQNHSHLPFPPPLNFGAFFLVWPKLNTAICSSCTSYNYVA